MMLVDDYFLFLASEIIILIIIYVTIIIANPHNKYIFQDNYDCHFRDR